MLIDNVRGSAAIEDAKANINTIDPRRAPNGFSYAWALERLGTARAGAVHYAERLAIPASVVFERGDLLLWVGQPAVDEDSLLNWAQDLLDPPALGRLRAIRCPMSRIASLTVHSALRGLLGEALGADPRSVMLRTDNCGKPHLPENLPGRLEFSLSHTSGRVMVGLAASRVGVDTEFRKPFDDMIAVAEMIFPDELVADLMRCSGTIRTDCFYRHWCLSEAFLKATGHGLPLGCSEFMFNGHGDDTLRWVAPEFGQLDQWQFGSL